MHQRLESLTLIRSGHAKMNPKEEESFAARMAAPLNESGIRDAHQVRYALQNPVFDAIVASLAWRDVETASIVANLTTDEEKENITQLASLSCPDPAEGSAAARLHELVAKPGSSWLRSLYGNDRKLVEAYGEGAARDLRSKVGGATRVLAVGESHLVASTTHALVKGHKELEQRVFDIAFGFDAVGCIIEFKGGIPRTVHSVLLLDFSDD
jgi:broad specificity phosphatase PhoE